MNEQITLSIFAALLLVPGCKGDEKVAATGTDASGKVIKIDGSRLDRIEVKGAAAGGRPTRLVFVERAVEIGNSHYELTKKHFGVDSPRGRFRGLETL